MVLKNKINFFKNQLFFIFLFFFLSQNSFSQNDSIYFADLGQQFRSHLKSNLDSAEIIAKKIKQEATQKDFRKGMGLGNNYVGICHLYQGRYDTALFYFNNALKFYGEKNLTKGLCDVYSNMGVCYDYTGKFSEAIKYYLKAVKIAELINDENALARACNNLGAIFYQQHNFKTAMMYFERSLKIREKENDMYGIASCCLNIGSCFSELKQPEKGNYFLNKSIKNALLAGDSVLLADGYLNLAKNYSDQKQVKKALLFYNKALPIYLSFNDPRTLSELYSHIALMYSKVNDQKLSHIYFMKAYKLAKKSGSLESIKSSASGLIVTYAYINKPDSVSFYLNEYSLARDSVFSENSTKQIADMQTKYETNKKDQELKVKDLTIEKQTAESQKKVFQRNAFIIGFGLMIILSVFIYRGYRQKQKANIEISEQKEIITNQKFIVEEKNKEITDSITYAQRIQGALLAGKTLLSRNLTEYFILFKPKDIVSGDFYWAAEAHGKFYIIIADCTGHGVPGAFMSLLNISFLNEAINEKNLQTTNAILAHVRQKLILNLAEDGSVEGGKDGMDCSLLCFDLNKKQLCFCGANNPIMIVRNNEILHFEADRMPVGKSPKEAHDFTETIIELKQNDIVYAFTDGYPDQFGGPKGKKFKHKNLSQLILSNAQKPLAQQKEMLAQEFNAWKGNLEQIDDVLIVGIKV